MARNNEGFFLCQRKYALDIISEVGYLGCKPIDTPLVQNHQLGVDDSPLLDDPVPYHRLVGRLVYLGVTRHDLTFGIHILSQYM